MNNNSRRDEDIHQHYVESDEDDNDEDKRTVFCANLPEKITEELLYELFLQAGPIESIKIPKDKDGRQRNFGFVTYVHLCTVPYALQLYEGTSLFKQKIVVKARSQNNSNSKDNSHLNNSSRRRIFDSSEQLRGNNNSYNNYSDRNMQPVAKRSRQDDAITFIDLMKNEILKNELVAQLAPNVFSDILFPKDKPSQSSHSSRTNNSTPNNRNEYRNKNNNRRGDDQWYHNQRSHQQRRRYR